MSNILNNPVLSLNRLWKPIGVVTVAEAIIAMSGGSDGHPAVGMDIDFSQAEDGSVDYSAAAAYLLVAWEQWIDLPVRSQDSGIRTANRVIRAPTVIVQANYAKMPLKRPKLNARAIWERDGGICQYSRKKLTRKQGNIDHVNPKDRGGRDTWENMVVCDVGINSRKGNRLNSEVGLKLIRQPKAPPALPVAVTIREAAHPHWTPFLIR